MTNPSTLDALGGALVAALRRDAATLETDGAPDLGRLAEQLDALLARVQGDPGPNGRRILLQVLDEVERFHGRVKTGLDATREQIAGDAQRRLARNAYSEARRYAGAGRP